MSVDEEVAIVMGLWQYRAGDGSGVLAGCEEVRRRRGGDSRSSAAEGRRRLCIARCQVDAMAALLLHLSAECKKTTAPSAFPRLPSDLAELLSLAHYVNWPCAGTGCSA
jgi:hypothetical protein